MFFIFSLIFLFTSCKNIVDNDSYVISNENDYTEYNSFLTFNCYENSMDTITVHELMKYDSLCYWGKTIISVSNHIFFQARIKYLNKDIVKNRLPSYYGRNTEHLTFSLYSDSVLLFSNNIVQYDTIRIGDLSKLLQQYYFDEKTYLNYKVKKGDKGIDVMVYKNIDEKTIQTFIDSLAIVYINIIKNYCKAKFGQDYKNISPTETIQTIRDIKLNTEITFSSINSIYYY